MRIKLFLSDFSSEPSTPRQGGPQNMAKINRWWLSTEEQEKQEKKDKKKAKNKKNGKRAKTLEQTGVVEPGRGFTGLPEDRQRE